MNAPQVLVTFFSILMLFPSIASLTKFDQWWVRGFDFPRLQISVLTLLVLGFAVYLYTFDVAWHLILAVLLGTSFVYQVVKIFPYTILAKKQVLRFKGSDPDKTISILVSNVLTTNDNYGKLISHVTTEQPDLLLTLETNKRWEQALSVIEEDYAYNVKIPQDNLYGMHLYSKLELLDMEVKFIISKEVPSIHGHVRLSSGEKIKIHCLHPKPPSPSEDETSTNRDAELLVVGKDAKADKESILVFGDLNDVAWSRTTRLFQKISGLLDPRIGRGFYNTFHTGYPLLRWPLDHIFHSPDFTLIELKRLKNIESDHFPIFIKLNYEPRVEQLQEEPEAADDDEKRWADEKIQDGNPREQDV